MQPAAQASLSAPVLADAAVMRVLTAETAKAVPANLTASLGSDIYGQSTATTGVLAQGGSVSSLIDFDNDHDWFAVTLQAGVIYDFAMNGTGATPLEDPYLELFDSSGTLLLHDDDGGAGRNAHLAFYATSTGTYYISAESWTDDDSGLTYQGGYTLTLSTGTAPTGDTVGDNMANAATLALGVSQSSRIDTPADNDWYAVDLVAGQGYDFTLTGSPTFDVELMLYDANGTLIARNDDFGTTTDSHLDFEAATTGRYYLVARGLDNAAYGDYTISAAAGDRPLLTTSIDWGTQVAAPTGQVKVYFATSGETYDGQTSLGWNAYEIQQVMAVLATYAHYINLTFVQTTNASEAQFRMVVNNDLDSGVLAYMNPPGTDNAGVGVFARDGAGWDEGGSGGLEPGGLGWATLIHELGHGLGLAHPFDGGGKATVMTGVFDEDDYSGYGWQNQGVYTVMSYNDGWPGGPVPDTTGRTSGYQSTPMAIDVAALQAKYGVNATWNNGDSVYTLSATTSGPGYLSIWDTGGNDTITVANVNSTVKAVIDLTPASMYYTGAGSGGAVSYMDGIASGLVVDAGVIIENAIGGAGNDVITGNSAANTLTGNGGDDTLYGAAGLDTLNAGAGSDILDGGAGADFMNGGAGADTYYVDNVGDAITEVDDGTMASVFSTVSWTLAAHFADLVLLGAAVVSGTGNDEANRLIGNESNNVLSGGLGDDYLSGGGGNDQLLGGDGFDRLYGSNGNDLLDSGDAVGGSFMEGDAGNDTFVVRGAGDQVYEFEDGGSDTQQNWISGVIADNIETLMLMGADNLTATGSAGANILVGNSGNNVLTGQSGADQLSGGAGNDTLYGGFSDNTAATDDNDSLDGGTGDDRMVGGAGDDSYTVDSLGDVVVEAAGFGTDLIRTAITYTLVANIENLTLTGSALINGTGNAQANVITGNANSNVLDGLGGVDTLVGGLGNDTYVIDNAADKAIEAAGAGTDTVVSSVTFVLGANIERMTLTGTANIGGTGNELANQITGNTGNNKLDGGLGADTLIGGLGNDTYTIDDAGDKAAENANEGLDQVNAWVSYVLGSNVENLQLMGTADLNATGNGLNNVIWGTSGANRLDGGAGADKLLGGLGDDTYVLDNASDQATDVDGGGIDIVFASQSHILSQYVENLTLTGSANITATGNALDNILIGNSGNNRLTGGAGMDAMTGGAGHDTYYVDNVADTVTEGLNAGIDLVQSTVSFVLSDNVENLFLNGTGDLNGTGNAINNLITGTSGNNILDGADGVDKLFGGLGDDTYYLDNASDSAKDEINGGHDVVYSSASWVMTAYIEDMFLTGSANITGTGNALVNILSGNDGNNKLDGGTGNDTLTGGLGNDIFVFNTNSGVDTITDFTTADTINLKAYSHGVAYGGGITVSQVGSDVLIDLGGGNTVSVLGVLTSDLNGHIIW